MTAVLLGVADARYYCAVIVTWSSGSPFFVRDYQCSKSMPPESTVMELELTEGKVVSAMESNHPPAE
jgi:hypothetical protein